MVKMSKVYFLVMESILHDPEESLFINERFFITAAQ